MATSIVARALLALTLSVGACHRWRPETTPPSMGSGSTTLRIETRPLATGEARRLTLQHARVSGDSIAGVVNTDYVRQGNGRWSIVSATRGTRVTLAIADIASIARAEISPGRTTALVVGVAAVGLVGFVAIGYLMYTGNF